MTTFRPSRQRHPASRPNVPARRFNAFTLVEILVVIGIILILSAILFPVLKGIQERGAQTTCATNMQQIYLAVRLYKDDEREYPASLAVLLPSSTSLQNAAGTTDPDNGLNTYGTGYYRKGMEDLKCPDDDTDVPESAGASPTGTPSPTTTPVATQTNFRSSYGDVTNAPDKKTYYEQTITNDPNNADFLDDSKNTMRDWGRYSWNAFGLTDQGVALRSRAEALAYLGKIPAADAKQMLRSPNKAPKPENATLVPPGSVVGTGATAFYFNPQGLVSYTDDYGNTVYAPEPAEENPLRYSLANRFAPDSTIITHCVYHRIQTGSNVVNPNPKMTYGTPADGDGARDIVLRLDGTAKSYDISKWNSRDFPRAGHLSNWQISDF